MRFRNIFCLFILAIFVTACSRTPVKPMPGFSHKRTIASVGDLRTLFREVTVGYVMGHVLMKQFDSCIGANGLTLSGGNNFWSSLFGAGGRCGSRTSEDGILGSPLYGELLAHRTVMEELEHSINEVYLENVDILANSSDAAERQRSETLLGELSTFMDAAASQSRTRVEGVSGDISPELYAFAMFRLEHKHQELQALLQERAASGHGRSEVYNERVGQIEARVRRFQALRQGIDTEGAGLQAALRSFAENNRDLSALHDRLSAIGAQIQSLRPHRQPNTAPATCPSTGRNGNVTGNTFPANTWSITYDDGPGAATTPQVLQNLQTEGVKASFFMLAKQVRALPDLARQIKDQGHEVALHSFNHEDVGRIVSGTRRLPEGVASIDAFIDTEINRAKSTVETTIGGVTVTSFRLPYGSGVSRAATQEGRVLVTPEGAARIRQRIADLRMVHYFWNVDTLDWQDHNVASIVERANTQIAQRGKGVILFHDIHSQSVTASNQVIQGLKRAGKIIKPSDQVIREQNGTQSCP